MMTLNRDAPFIRDDFDTLGEDEKLIQSREDSSHLSTGEDYGTVGGKKENPGENKMKKEKHEAGVIDEGKGLDHLKEKDDDEDLEQMNSGTKRGTLSIQQITKQPRSFYSFFCNRWLSLLGAAASILAMFAIQWGYALINILIVIVIYVYIGLANPGVLPGIAEFSIIRAVQNVMKRCCRRGLMVKDERVVTPGMPDMQTTSDQLTDENEDFASRGRFHQSEIVKGKNFDDYTGN